MDHSSAILEVERGGPPASYPSALVAPDYFEALDQPILAGRGFHAGDLEGDRTAVIVSSGFVDLAMGGENPVGRRVRRVASLGGDDPGPWHEVVGVAPSLGMDLTEPEDLGAGVYFPAAPGEMNPLWLAVHVGPDPTSFAPRLRELTGEVDPSIMIARLTALDEVFPEDWYLFQALMAGWGLFVVVLLTLASSGVYAMMAFTVAQRTREIGIRSALGARPTDIVAAIGRRAAIQLGSGALLGMVLGGQVYHSIREGTVTGGTALAVAALPAIGAVLLVGLLACTVPLRRALRIEPTEAMRGE
jgi:putative ABC transport system permease protein